MPGYEVRWNRRSFGWNLLLLFAIFLIYVGLALFASGVLEIIGIVGAVAFALILTYGMVSGLKQLRRSPVAATLTQSGITFYRQNPASWDTLKEVRTGRVKPHWLFALRPHYVAFVPLDPSSLQRNLKYKLAIRLYGTSFILMTQTVDPSADEILAAVRRFSDVRINP
jgi:hypothetical protein